jgi:hypothetical protein
MPNKPEKRRPGDSIVCEYFACSEMGEKLVKTVQVAAVDEADALLSLTGQRGGRDGAGRMCVYIGDGQIVRARRLCIRRRQGQ